MLTASQAVGQRIYDAAAAAAQATGEGGEGEAGTDDDVVEAEIIDDESDES